MRHVPCSLFRRPPGTSAIDTIRSLTPSIIRYDPSDVSEVNRVLLSTFFWLSKFAVGGFTISQTLGQPFFRSYKRARRLSIPYSHYSSLFGRLIIYTAYLNSGP